MCWTLGGAGRRTQSGSEVYFTDGQQTRESSKEISQLITINIISLVCDFYGLAWGTL